jgi:endonuclease YncB( thermonuclease family)
MRRSLASIAWGSEMLRQVRWVRLALVLNVVLAACGSVEPSVTAPDLAPSDPSEPATGPSASWSVTTVIDGDTIDVLGPDGVTERVRLIGIDAPEFRDCGFEPAYDLMAALVLDRVVELVPGTREDRDRFGRILRYVDVDGVDAGLELIRAGLAVARYDSRDGYGRHDREDEYVAADEGLKNDCDAESEATSERLSSGGHPIVKFRNCAELNAVYPGGVAQTGVTGDMRSGRLEPFGRMPVFDDELYAANIGRDGDKDGIACEQR